MAVLLGCLHVHRSWRLAGPARLQLQGTVLGGFSVEVDLRVSINISGSPAWGSERALSAWENDLSWRFGKEQTVS